MTWISHAIDWLFLVSPKIRAYDQVCPIATALDVLGDRWTLLVVRDLVLGPRRFTDLQRGLPGLAPDVLTARLRHLQSAGLVAAIDLPPPASHRAYRLSGDGQEVRSILQALGRWGWSRMPEPRDPDDLSAGRVLVTCLIDPSPTAIPDGGVWEMWIDLQPATVTVAGGRLDIAWGTAPDPDARVRMSVAVLWALVRSRLDVDVAIARGAVQVDGDPHDARAVIDALRHPVRGDVSPA
jgi:DNA-binding HxlR family transcriptional regulator